MTNRVNGLSYIGQTIKTVNKRWRAHLTAAKFGVETLVAIAIREFGVEAFDVEVLEENDDLESLDFLERKYIREFNTNVCAGGIGYNQTSGGQTNAGYKWSETQKDKKRLTCPVDSTTLQSDCESLTLNQIALKYTVSVSVIRRWLKNAAISKKKLQFVFNNQGTGAWTLSDEDKLLQMYLDRVSFVDIAGILGRTTTAVTVKLARLKHKRGLKIARRRNHYMNDFSFGDR